MRQLATRLLRCARNDSIAARLRLQSGPFIPPIYRGSAVRRITVTLSHDEDDTEPSRCSKYLPCVAFDRHVAKRGGFATTRASAKSPDCDLAARGDGGAVHLHGLGTAAGVLDPARSSNRW